MQSSQLRLGGLADDIDEKDALMPRLRLGPVEYMVCFAPACHTEPQWRSLYEDQTTGCPHHASEPFNPKVTLKIAKDRLIVVDPILDGPSYDYQKKFRLRCDERQAHLDFVVGKIQELHCGDVALATIQARFQNGKPLGQDWDNFFDLPANLEKAYSIYRDNPARISLEARRTLTDQLSELSCPICGTTTLGKPSTVWVREIVVGIAEPQLLPVDPNHADLSDDTT